MTQEERDRWETYRNNLQTRSDSIMIPVDVDSAALKRLTAEIDQFYSQVRIDFADIRSQKNKIDRCIYVVEKKAAVDGRNELSRRANGIAAAERFTTDDGTVINLYAKADDIDEKFEFILAIVDILDRKRSSLISVNGALKLERDLL